MKNAMFYVGLAVLGIVLYAVIPPLGGRGSRFSSSEDVATVTYLCRETSELVAGPPGPTPAVNPRTGRATLVRALYCPKCDRWHAVPPSELYSGNPMTYPCPRHKSQMSSEGPMNRR